YKPGIYPDNPWYEWAYETNSYNEMYYTYLGDHIRSYQDEPEDYARYYFEFGNPYTSNLDLSRIGNESSDSYVPNLANVSRIKQTEWDINSGGYSGDRK